MGGGCTIDAYTVTWVSVCENLGAIANGEGGASAAGRGVILLREDGDGWLG